VDVDGYLQPTGKWANDAWKLHLWFDFSNIPANVPDQRTWERIKYSVNIMGELVAERAQEDDFEISRVGYGYRYTVPTAIYVPPAVGAMAAQHVSKLRAPTITVTIHVVKTPFEKWDVDRTLTFFIRCLNVPKETEDWASKNELGSTAKLEPFRRETPG